jgi:hypothetical protein
MYVGIKSGTLEVTQFLAPRTFLIDGVIKVTVGFVSGSLHAASAVEGEIFEVNYLV